VDSCDTGTRLLIDFFVAFGRGSTSLPTVFSRTFAVVIGAMDAVARS
jgi:hypothetical protein